MSLAYVTLDSVRILQYGSIYLDFHGEADPTLFRGKPLFLSQLRVGELEKLACGLQFAADTKLMRRIARLQLR